MKEGLSLNIPEPVLWTTLLAHDNCDKIHDGKIGVGINPYDILEKDYTILL